MNELIRTLPITHKSGLHARASTMFVELARKYESDVFMCRGDTPGGEEVDGKSVLGILTLGAQLGDQVTLRIVGKDAEGALEALAALIEDDFKGV